MQLSILQRNVLLLKNIPNFGNKTIIKLFEDNYFLHQHLVDHSFVYTIKNLRLEESFKSGYSKAKDISEKVSEYLEINKIDFIDYFSIEYPSSLRSIADPPVILFYKGDLRYLYSRSIAVVGSRKSSSYGESNCKDFIIQLAVNDFSIVSGLAAGIDAVAHGSAIACGLKCLAVIGHGLNHIYPKYNKKLFEDILKNNGCIISEFMPDELARPEYFPRRNRIVAGLSSSILVIEAGLKSGSLITAKYAFESNRFVYAIPGDINKMNSQGCNLLIKNNIAKLVTSIDDIMEDYS